MAIKCPRCGEINKDGDNACWSCLMPFESNSSYVKPGEVKISATVIAPAGKHILGKTGKRQAVLLLFKKIFEFIRVNLIMRLFSGSKEKKILVYLSLLFLLISAINNIFYFISLNDSIYGLNKDPDQLNTIILLVYLFLAGFSVFQIVKGRMHAIKRIYSVVLAVLAVMAGAYIIPVAYNHIRLISEFILLLVLVIMLWAYKEQNNQI
jgi:hypothetical protein